MFFSFFCLLEISLFSTMVYSHNSSPNVNDNSFLQQNTPLSMWDVQLNINVTGSYGVYDGTFFYVTDGVSNLIKVYDVNGNLLYNTTILGVTGLKDLTFDGQFEYGGTGGNTIYQMNFQTGTLIGIISAPISVRYIAYDYDNDAFWVGTWGNNSVTLVSRSGTVLTSLYLSLTSITGIAYDGESPDGPYLWLFTSGTPGPLLIHQLNVTNGTFTGITHNVSDDIGIGQPNASSGGLFFTDQFISNTCSLGGVLVGNPTKLFIYELYNSVPVELISFTADSDENGVKLNWSTSTETNNYGFEIYSKKEEEKDWRKIGFVNGNGTSVKKHNYSFTDNDIEQGVYQYRLKQIDFDGSSEYSKIVNVEINQPEEFSLSQNYPNPFNPTTNLSFIIGHTSFVSLKIYDILGNEVTTLINEVKNPAKYDVEFNASGLPSGIYFYKLKTIPDGGHTGNFVEIKKMMLLK